MKQIILDDLSSESVIAPAQLERLKEACKVLPSPVVPTLADLPWTPYDPLAVFWLGGAS